MQNPPQAIRLPPPQTAQGIAALLAGRRSVREYQAVPLSLAAIGQLLWAAQGVSGGGGRRTAPSAGALYPLEIYLAVGNVEGLAAGVYRDLPAARALRPVAEGDRRALLAAAALGQRAVREAPAVLVLAAVYSRSSAKYGARTRRYVQIEAGHAAQNVYLQAAALGLGTVDIGAFDDGAVARALGLPRDVAPLLLMPVGRPRPGGRD